MSITISHLSLDRKVSLSSRKGFLGSFSALLHGTNISSLKLAKINKNRTTNRSAIHTEQSLLLVKTQNINLYRNSCYKKYNKLRKTRKCKTGSVTVNPTK